MSVCPLDMSKIPGSGVQGLCWFTPASIPAKRCKDICCSLSLDFVGIVTVTSLDNVQSGQSLNDPVGVVYEVLLVCHKNVQLVSRLSRTIPVLDVKVGSPVHPLHGNVQGRCLDSHLNPVATHVLDL